MPAQSGKNNHRHRAKDFSAQSNPGHISRTAIADRKGSRCQWVRDSLRVEDRDELRESSFKELAALGLFIARVVSHAPTLELWTKLDGTDELSDAELGRLLKLNRSTVGHRLEVFRRHLQEIAWAHPEWIAELPERYRRMILGPFRNEH